MAPNIVPIVPAHATAKDQPGNSAACKDFKAAFEYLRPPSCDEIC